MVLIFFLWSLSRISSYQTCDPKLSRRTLSYLEKRLCSNELFASKIKIVLYSCITGLKLEVMCFVFLQKLVVHFLLLLISHINLSSKIKTYQSYRVRLVMAVALKFLSKKKNLQTFCCGFRFQCRRILWKALKNCFGYLALQSTSTAVCYFKSCSFKKKFKA